MKFMITKPADYYKATCDKCGTLFKHSYGGICYYISTRRLLEDMRTDKWECLDSGETYCNECKENIQLPNSTHHD